MQDFRDLYNLYEGHPRFEILKIEEDDAINVVLQKYENILFTNKGEVLGDPDFGANLLELLYQTKVSENFVKDVINDQIARYIPELLQTGYTLEVVFAQDPENYQDIMFTKLAIGETEVYARIGALAAQ